MGGTFVRDGLLVRQRSTGVRRPVVFVHGAMDRSAAFLRVMRILDEHPVLAHDRRGYGRSVLPEGSDAVGFEQHVVDLLDLCAVARHRHGTVPLLVGHSLGGSIAMRACERDPDAAAGLMTFESPLLWEPWWPAEEPNSRADPRSQNAGESFIRRLIGDDAWEELPEGTRARRRAEGPVLEAELHTARRHGPMRWDRLTMPAVVAGGSGLVGTRLRSTETQLAALPGSIRVELPGAPHNAHVADPDAFARAVRTLADAVGG